MSPAFTEANAPYHSNSRKAAILDQESAIRHRRVAAISSACGEA